MIIGAIGIVLSIGVFVGFVFYKRMLQQKYIVITDDGQNTTSQLLHMLDPINCVLSDEKLNVYFPPPSSPTMRKFVLAQEANYEFKNLSASDLQEKGIEGITLREYLIYHKRWFDQFKTHLDIKSVTLCTGSPLPNKFVLGADFNGTYIDIHEYSPFEACSYLCVRKVV